LVIGRKKVAPYQCETCQPTKTANRLIKAAT
jgi:hypothetical protein